MSDMVLVKGEKSQLLWANKSFLSYYNITEEQIKNIIDAKHSDPDDTLQYVKDDYYVFSRGKTLEISSEQVTKFDGTVNYFRTIKDPILDNSGHVIMQVGSSRLIKDMSTMEKASEERYERKISTSELKALISALPNPTIMLDATARIISYSEEWEKIFPHNHDDLTGKYFDNIYLDKLSLIILKLKEIEQMGLIEVREYEVEQGDLKRIMNFKIKPWYFPKNEFGGTIVIANDVTELKKNEEALKKAIKARDEFLSIASHELKTPITSLKIQLQIIRRGINPEKHLVPPAEQLAEVIDFSINQIDRLTKLVEGMLDASAMQTGKFKFNFEDVNLSQIIGLVIDSFAAELISAKCQVELKLDEHIVGRWDKVRIKQVLDNLISNAIKYAAGSKIFITAEQYGTKAKLTMKDTGPGISKEKQMTIFNRFERATPYRNISGLGLGLYICRQIIEAFGGTIEIQSEEGKGATFIIELPLVVDEDHKSKGLVFSA
jgi:two-component system phosphate regulon sensor histidine kinase PhoR